MQKPKTGDWVEVRSKEEILRSLDKNGQLDGLPFMPQMFEYCGRRFKVYKRAHKTCDTVFPVRGRRMANAVHLEVRCNGEAYGGCQAGCLIFWKEAWLKRVNDERVTGTASAREESGKESAGETKAGCTVEDVWAGTRVAGQGTAQEPIFICQATRLPYATMDLAWWDARQYLEDYTSGNATLKRMALGFIYMAYRSLINAGIGLGPSLRWLYDLFQSLWGGIPYPRRHGTIPVGRPTPAEKLDLRPGEWVRVKSYEAILATCNLSNENRGMRFDAELVPFCGGTYRVLTRVTKILDERTGKMQEMKNPCIILEGVACESKYSECRLFCPRAIYSYWREIWLERVGEPSPSPAVSRD